MPPKSDVTTRRFDGPIHPRMSGEAKALDLSVVRVEPKLAVSLKYFGVLTLACFIPIFTLLMFRLFSNLP
jgi:hypothetical protein